MPADQLQLVLVTPEKTLLDEPVQALRIPLFDGSAGIFPGRAPLIGRLGYGELRVTSVQGDRSYFIDGGFVQVKGETVSVLTNRAIPAADLDVDNATELLRTASARTPHTEEAFLEKDRDQQRARQMLAIAGR